MRKPSKSPRAQAAEKARASLKAMTPEEDAAITRDAERDLDNPPLTDAQLAAMRPVAKVAPELVALQNHLAEERRKGGRPKAEEPKVATSIRLSQGVLDHFKASGERWQTRINAVLEEHIRKQKGTVKPANRRDVKRRPSSKSSTSKRA